MTHFLQFFQEWGDFKTICRLDKGFKQKRERNTRSEVYQVLFAFLEMLDLFKVIWGDII